jgi:hypothetical protein
MGTLSSITQRVLVEIRDLSGQDVQVYTQPVVYAKLQALFNEKFRARWWRRFVNYSTYTLDGTTGAILTDVSLLIKDPQDIGAVWLASARNPLPQMPLKIPPALVSQQCIQQTSVAANGYFKVVPYATTGTVTVMYRTKPTDFVATDTIPFDEEWLVAACAAEIVLDEGINTTAAKRLADKAKRLYDQLLENEGEMEQSFFSPTSSGLNDWSTR